MLTIVKNNGSHIQWNRVLEAKEFIMLKKDVVVCTPIRNLLSTPDIMVISSHNPFLKTAI
jgi:hypothetical protein